ncbi:hypothetical protein TNCV_180071 [Trichonephila clavipes]|nr:hypothetical protein TNCV_180071 [Trichonephila clavipes]
MVVSVRLIRDADTLSVSSLSDWDEPSASPYGYRVTAQNVFFYQFFKRILSHALTSCFEKTESGAILYLFGDPVSILREVLRFFRGPCSPVSSRRSVFVLDAVWRPE